MKEPKWLTKHMVLAIHDKAVAMFGGIARIGDEGSLEDALDRSQTRHADEYDATMFELVASLCYGICQNHPFLDGNKRTALLSGRAFLFLNGYAFEPREVDEVENMVAVASGTMDEAGVAAWFREFSAPIKAARK